MHACMVTFRVTFNHTCICISNVYLLSKVGQKDIARNRKYDYRFRLKINDKIFTKKHYTFVCHLFYSITYFTTTLRALASKGNVFLFKKCSYCGDYKEIITHI